MTFILCICNWLSCLADLVSLRLVLKRWEPKDYRRPSNVECEVAITRTSNLQTSSIHWGYLTLNKDSNKYLPLSLHNVCTIIPINCLLLQLGDVLVGFSLVGCSP